MGPESLPSSVARLPQSAYIVESRVSTKGITIMAPMVWVSPIVVY